MRKYFILSFIILLFTKNISAQHWPAMATSCASAGTLKKDPQGNNLYAGGDFCDLNGNTQMKCIAMWDGNNWNSLDTGITNSNAHCFVNDIEFYNNQLYAGGAFTNAGALSTNNIAQWNGSSWATLGAGTDSAVFDMCVYNGELYVGGMFAMAGSVTANGLAKWNGSSWSAVPNWTNEIVSELEVYNGELYAATATGNILKFNGANWLNTTTLSTTAGSPFITCMKTVNNRLYVGGYFESTLTLLSKNLVYFDGTNWNNAGITNYGSGWPMPIVNDLYDYNGTLLITGTFDSINNNFANGFAYYSGTSWQVFNGGSGPYDGYCLEIFQGDIYAGSRNEIDRYDSTLSIFEHQENFSANVFPNPSSDFIHVTISEKNIEQAEIYDVNGNVVKEFIKPSNDIFIGDLSPGIYFLKIESGNKFFSAKFIRLEK